MEFKWYIAFLAALNDFKSSGAIQVKTDIEKLHSHKNTLVLWWNKLRWNYSGKKKVKLLAKKLTKKNLLT